MNVARKLFAVALQCVLLTMIVTGSTGACERMLAPAMDASMPDSHQHHAPPPASEQQPAAPDDCVQMTACSLTAVTVSAVVIQVPATAIVETPMVRVETPLSVTRAPEPPPPRARLG